MILKEVAYEVEYWLLDINGNVQEPPAFNFPHDEMGFLLELRSPWGSNPREIVDAVKAAYRHQEEKASTLGLRIDNSPYKEVSSDWQKYIALKYNHIALRDLTLNVYGNSEVTHHTGFNENTATAGLHIHFSLFDTDSETYVPIPIDVIEGIIMEMDRVYAREIESVGRIAGEWEPKGVHRGFEYRSLPTNVPHYKALLDALIIFDELTPDMQ
jgi:hypothetical protein